MDLHGQVLAATECAAHAREVDAHLLERKAEARGDLVAVDVEPLRRDVDVDAALAVRDREAGLRPEERLVLDAELVDALDDHVARRLGVAVPDHHVADDVGSGVVAVAVPHRRAVRVERLLLERTLHVDDRLERLVLDDDRVERAARLLGMLRRDDRDRLADVAHAVDREDGLVRELEAVRLAPGDVGVGEDGVDARLREGGGDVERHDPRVGARAAQRVPPQHPGRGEVARVGEVAPSPSGSRRRGGGARRRADAERSRRDAHGATSVAP